MRNRSRNIFIAVCTVPPLLLYIVFFLYPAFKAFMMGFYSWSGLTSGSEKFTGLENFKTLVKDPIVWTSIKNNFFLMLVIPVITMIISLFFAVLLTRRKLPEKNFYRTVFFFPNVLSVVVISVLWNFVYNPVLGILNSLLEAIGLDNLTRPWLGDSSTVLWAIAVTSIWSSIGFYMVLYMAGIENIPVQLYEAATIDGAGEFKQFTHITFPLLWEVIRVTIIFFISGIFYGSFTYVNVMTNGGPDRASEVLTHYMYKQAFNSESLFANSNVGYATAIGIVIFIIGISLSLLSVRLTARESVEF